MCEIGWYQKGVLYYPNQDEAGSRARARPGSQSKEVERQGLIVVLIAATN